MTDCLNAEIRESLPDLVHGRLSAVDTATLTAHVEWCEACAAELAFLNEVRASAPIAPRIDVASIVAALPARSSFVSPASAEVPRRGVFNVRPLFWKLAAVAAIVTAGTVVFDGGNRRSQSAPPLVASLPSTSTTATAPALSVAPEAQGSVAASPVAGLENASLSLVAGVQDLSDDDIETLLAELDGIDGVPAVEPQPAPLSMNDFEVEG